MSGYLSYGIGVVGTLGAIAVGSYLYVFKTKKRPYIISVDGNIGSGKSTFLKILRETLDPKQVSFADEPVNIWTNVGEDNLLEQFYQDKNRWSYTFQNFAYITRLMELDKAKKQGRPIIITERSVLTDRNIFAKMLYESKCLSQMEMSIYQHWYDFFNCQVDHTVYLKTDVENCLARIKKRGRDAENGITQDYLSLLHQKHDEWLTNDPNATVLDGNINFVSDPDARDSLVNKFKKIYQDRL